MKKVIKFLKKHYLILLLVFLLFPIRVYYQDGGSFEYRAILYKIAVQNPMSNNRFIERKRKTTILLFPYNFHSINYYTDLEPEKVHAYIGDQMTGPYPDLFDSIPEHVECNIGTYSITKTVDKDTFRKNNVGLHPVYQDYLGILNVKKDDLLKLKREQWSKIKDVKIYEENNLVPLDTEISYDEESDRFLIGNIKTNIYIISFTKENYYGTANYSFKIKIMEE